jgi:hypothetical protein
LLLFFTKDGIKNRVEAPFPCHDPEDREDYLVQVLQQGLPNPRNCMKTVTIVGAGMSGLTGKWASICVFVQMISHNKHSNQIIIAIKWGREV